MLGERPASVMVGAVPARELGLVPRVRIWLSASEVNVFRCCGLLGRRWIVESVGVLSPPLPGQRSTRGT